MKQCQVCGTNQGKIISSTRFNMTVCNKHYRQLQNHGEISERTMRDSNEIVVIGDYAEMSLYDQKNKLVGKALIDSEDIPLIRKRKWYLEKRTGYVNSGKGGDKISLHRFIMKPKEEEVVDHKDGNKLDNRKINLQAVKQLYNVQKKQKQSNNTSGVIGVWYHKQRSKWVAELKTPHKKHYLGAYDDIESAIRIRLEGEKKYFGEFAPQKHLFSAYGV
ncbi:HNH endonuclease [Bacillus cereus]|uniref:HNH endonuclease n=1 Tax=Bacillus cereus TaxID=1396 RepID=UPI0035583912